MMSENRANDKEIRSILEFINVSTAFLQKYGLSSPRLDAEVLLAHVLGLQRIQLYTNFDRPLEEAEKNQYRELLLRRAKKEPIAYIIGKKEFYGYDIEINPSVLIPRPETEFLVDFILAWHEFLPVSWQKIRMLDLGTGSGCLALALLMENGLPERFILSDISEKALHTARVNLERYSLFPEKRISLEKKDGLNDFPDNYFHIIVSNPPYIGEDERESLMDDVRNFEPEQALFSGKEGKDFIEHIIHFGRQKITEDGIIFCEIGNNMSASLRNLALQDGWQFVEMMQDVSGKDRYLLLAKKDLSKISSLLEKDSGSKEDQEDNPKSGHLNNLTKQRDKIDFLKYSRQSLKEKIWELLATTA